MIELINYLLQELGMKTATLTNVAITGNDDFEAIKAIGDKTQEFYRKYGYESYWYMLILISVTCNRCV